MIRVGVVGYGTIGSRVADAVRSQSDMELIGVVKPTPDYRAEIAVSLRGIRFFAPSEEGLQAWRERGLPIHGTLDDLLREADVVVDTTPGGKGREMRNRYESAGVKAVFQGGEPPDVAEVSFVAQVNYDAARGRRSVRVVSCNTTGLARLLNALDREFGVERAVVTLVRRAADPKEVKKGPIDALVPDPPRVPSHHGPDLQTVIPGLNVITMAVKAPTTHSHVHSLAVKLGRETSREEVLGVLSSERRIVLVSAASGFRSTADVLDIGRELGRPRADIYENVVWADSVSVDGRWLYLFQAIHQEAIVIPENIDAIRAIATDLSAERSMDLTDASLGVKSGRIFRPP